MNVYKPKLLCESILKNMVGQNVYTYSFMRKEMTITMASKAAVKVGNEKL